MPVSSDERIPLVPEGGTHSVPVTVNGAITLHFLIDTGAADVSIPVDVALTLLRTGTLSEADVSGTAPYRLADGSTVENAQVLLRTLGVGTRTIHNVRGSVGGVESQLLLGQSALAKLEPWRLDTQ